MFPTQPIDMKFADTVKQITLDLIAENPDHLNATQIMKLVGAELAELGTSLVELIIQAGLTEGRFALDGELRITLVPETDTPS